MSVNTAVKLTIGTALVPQSATIFMNYDTQIVSLTKLLVTLTDNTNAILYNNYSSMTTFQILQLTNCIKFITDYTTATRLVGDGINGTCTGTCYL